MQSVDKQWQEAFLKTVQQHEYAFPLKEAALQERLGDWTKELTSVVVATCEAMGWQASAKDHRLDMLPIGKTLVVVGNRNDSATFPYGFFKWWSLDINTGTFILN